MAPPYIKPAAVRSFTGVEPGHLDLSDEMDLSDTLVEWIAQAQEMVEIYVGVEWDHTYIGEENPDIIVAAVPRGVANAVLRIVANMVAQANVRRQGGILSLDEYTQRLIPDTVFTDSIKADLEPWIGGGRKYREEQLPTTGQFGFNLFRVRSKRQQAADAAAKHEAEAG